MVAKGILRNGKGNWIYIKLIAECGEQKFDIRQHFEKYSNSK